MRAFRAVRSPPAAGGRTTSRGSRWARRSFRGNSLSGAVRSRRLVRRSTNSSDPSSAPRSRVHGEPAPNPSLTNSRYRDGEPNRARRASGFSHEGAGAQTEGGAKARPRIVLCRGAHACPDRVQDDVAGQLEEVRFALDEDSLEAPLEHVADPIVPAVESLRVLPVQAPHASGQVRLGGLDEQVEVVRHQAVAVAVPVVGVDDLAQPVEEGVPIPVVEEDGFARIAPGGQVVEGAGELDAEWPSHESNGTAGAGQGRTGRKADSRFKI